MKVTTTLIGLLLTAYSSFGQVQTIYPTQTKSATVETDKERLKKNKNSIDAKFNSKNSKITVLAKTPDNKLIEIKNGKFPDEVVTSFNLLNDSIGRLILFKEIPFIESGDDYIEVTHYFDSEGKTYAITLVNNYFYEKGVAYWEKTTYYNKDFKEIGKAETLLDKNNRPLKKNNDFEFSYTSEFKQNKDLCLKTFDGLQKATLASTLPKIEDFYIPNNGNNKVTYFMPDRTGGKSGVTKTIYYKKTSEGFDITDGRFFQGKTTAIETSSIIIQNNEVRITKNITTNMFVTNKHKSFSPSIVLLKIPPRESTVSWTYTSTGGDKFNCIASWTMNRVEINGVVNDIPVIKVTKTTPAIKGKILEFYRKGDGLVKEQFISTNGQTSTQFEVSTYSHENLGDE